MNMLKPLHWLIMALSLCLPCAAMAEDDWDVTMTVLEEDADPEAAYEVIELPSPAAVNAREKAAKGLDRAAEARQSAGEARQQARDAARNGIGNDISRGALENLPESARDNLNRNRPEVPDQRPDR